MPELDFPARNFESLDLTNIDFSRSQSALRGNLGEAWVAERLGDRERVEALLQTWRTADLGTFYKERSHAHIPDWLVLNQASQIRQIVEVKTAASDLNWIEVQKRDYKKTWRKFLESNNAEADSTWNQRLSQNWRTAGERFIRQTSLHFKRAYQLQKAGKLKIVVNPEAVIYVPAKEVFKPWPFGIYVRVDEKRSLNIPLKVKLMPGVREFDNVIEKRKAELLATTTPVEIAKVASTVEKGSKNPAKELDNRFTRMAADWESVKQMFKITNLREFTDILKRMIVGKSNIPSEQIMSTLGSVTPNLACQTLFDMSGNKLQFLKPKDREKLLKGRAELTEGDTSERLMKAVVKFKNELKRKGH